MSQTMGHASADSEPGATPEPAGAPTNGLAFDPLVDRTAAPRSAGGSPPADAVAGGTASGSASRHLDAMAWSELLHWFG